MQSKKFEITKYLNALGQTVSIKNQNGGEGDILAIVQSFWNGGKSRYAKRLHKIGLTVDDYYSLICSADYNISSLNENDIAEFDNKKFRIVHTETVRVGNEIQYYSATLKRIWEEEDAFIN